MKGFGLLVIVVLAIALVLFAVGWGVHQEIVGGGKWWTVPLSCMVGALIWIIVRVVIWSRRRG